ncbi:MAG TPA: GDP-4-dehydro-6-deoxy-D-mannose reductase [Acidobacteria bacterium]|nr:GDP-4-dehydro-6-deoxy-D-mannose reductase [Acidobacteriota bacterium]
MHVLVTGISGFIGPRLARHLLAAGDRVSGTYYIDHPAFPEAGEVRLFEVDLQDAAGLERVIRETAPDAIIHLAGLSHVGESWGRMSEYFRVNVLGTDNLLTLAGGRPVVIASSAEVYGLVPEAEQPIAEDRIVDPRTPYALSKAAAERLGFLRGAVVARCFNLVGPGQATKFALPTFAAQLAAIARGEKEPVLRVGNLQARRDFVHVDDGAAAFRLLAARGTPGGVYNVASGRAFSIAEALDRLMAHSGVAARIEEDPERMRPADLPLLLGSSGPLRALGWTPERTLDDALADLWSAALPHPEGRA